jgi:hypothetical protein
MLGLAPVWDCLSVKKSHYFHRSCLRLSHIAQFLGRCLRSTKLSSWYIQIVGFPLIGKSFVENRLIQSTVYFTTLILQILLKVKFSQLKFENRCYHIIRLVKTQYHHDQTHPWTGQLLSTIDHVLNILILSPLSSTDLVEVDPVHN